MISQIRQGEGGENILTRKIIILKGWHISLQTLIIPLFVDTRKNNRERYTLMYSKIDIKYSSSVNI